MEDRALKIASGVTVALLALVAALALARLPEGARLPVHWSAAGEPDRFAPAALALFLPVLLCGAISLLMAVLPRIRSLQARMEASAPLYRATWAGLLGIAILVEAMIAAPAFGREPPGALALVGVGALLIILGNLLPKSRPNVLVGIRTPWTLADEDNWIATHRLGAWTMMAGGAAIVAAALLPTPPAARAALVTAAIAFAVIPPVIYSYLRRTRRTRV